MVKCLCRIPAVGSILSLVLPTVLENDLSDLSGIVSQNTNVLGLGIISFERVRDQTRKMSD